MSIYQERLTKVRSAMASQGIDLLVLTPSPYMFYLTGLRAQPYFGALKGPGDWINGVIISQERGPLLLVHWMVHRMLVRLPHPYDAELDEVRVLDHGTDGAALLAQAIHDVNGKAKRIAVADRTEAQFLLALQAALPTSTISFASELMDSIIAIKDAEALRHMRHVTAITDAAYGEALKFLRPGVTEEEVALEIDYQFRRLGAEGSSFRTSVVFTRRDDFTPTPGKRLLPGDSIMFDIGAYCNGYCGDFGRSVYVGEPPADYVALHELNLSAQAAGIAALKAGQVTCEEIVEVVQSVMGSGPYGRNLIPQVGHAIGMTVHEAPILLRGDDTVIQAGMTFTIEPTIRVPGKFSNRVEDIILVTETGAEYLSHFPRDLRIVAA
jgi:Xaa-Pro aminopeptidase